MLKEELSMYNTLVSRANGKMMTDFSYENNYSRTAHSRNSNTNSYTIDTPYDVDDLIRRFVCCAA